MQNVEFGLPDRSHQWIGYIRGMYPAFKLVTRTVRSLLNQGDCMGCCVPSQCFGNLPPAPCAASEAQEKPRLGPATRIARPLEVVRDLIPVDPRQTALCNRIGTPHVFGLPMEAKGAVKALMR